ncbi:hypothetical protein FB451DRAFT_1164108 [Mycena latifolia]|nr:hypothetical protein FB451DRAFT_1164108 [Mycena latifolia]
MYLLSVLLLPIITATVAAAVTRPSPSLSDQWAIVDFQGQCFNLVDDQTQSLTPVQAWRPDSTVTGSQWLFLNTSTPGVFEIVNVGTASWLSYSTLPTGGRRFGRTSSRISSQPPGDSLHRPGWTSGSAPHNERRGRIPLPRHIIGARRRIDPEIRASPPQRVHALLMPVPEGERELRGHSEVDALEGEDLPGRDSIMSMNRASSNAVRISNATVRKSDAKDKSGAAGESVSRSINSLKAAVSALRTRRRSVVSARFSSMSVVRVTCVRTPHRRAKEERGGVSRRGRESDIAEEGGIGHVQLAQMVHTQHQAGIRIEVKRREECEVGFDEIRADNEHGEVVLDAGRTLISRELMPWEQEGPDGVAYSDDDEGAQTRSDGKGGEPRVLLEGSVCSRDPDASYLQCFQVPHLTFNAASSSSYRGQLMQSVTSTQRAEDRNIAASVGGICIHSPTWPTQTCNFV